MIQQEDQNDDVKTEETLNTEASADALKKEPVKVDFPYSELLRSQLPKTFDVADKVATDWKHEGDFTDLGLSHPLAGIVASQALKKAKDVEKKLEEKGVFSMAKMGLALAKAQVGHIASKIKK